MPAKTIRYYESVGLLSPPSREANGYRVYKPADKETLVFIRRCRELNIPIKDIKQLVDVKRRPDASCATVDGVIAEQLERVQQMQRELTQLGQTLSSLISSCSSQQSHNCSILQSLSSDE